MTFNDFWNKYKKSLANKEKIEIALDAWSAGINSIRVEKLVSPKVAKIIDEILKIDKVNEDILYDFLMLLKKMIIEHSINGVFIGGIDDIDGG